MTAATTTRTQKAATSAPPPGASPATDYARAVVAAEIVAGPYVRRACQRHLDDLERQDTRGFPYMFDVEMEHRFYRFMRFVNLDDGVPFVLLPFQQFKTGSIFGWRHARTGWRRFRTAYIEEGKGNGKTPLASAVALYCLMADGEMQPEVYFAAVTRDQAGIGFRDAHNMATSSPKLAARLDIQEHNIAYGNGFLRTVSSEGRSLDGKRPHCVIPDEIHEHRTPEVLQKMRAGMKRRQQPLIFEITNSGYSRETICWEHHQHSLKVLGGAIVDETWFAYVCALDEGDDWHDRAVWPKTNPGLGTILPYEYLEEQVKEADSILRARAMVERLNFCIWNESVTRWLDVGLWDAEADSELALETMRGREAIAAVDLSTTTDITGLGLLFPPEAGDADQRYRWIPMFWVPADNMPTRASRDGVPYPVWHQDGWLEATGGNVVDYRPIRERLREIVDDYGIRVREVAYDRWNSSQFINELQEDGLTCVPIGQGYASMSAPAKELERMVLSGAIVHDGNPVMSWMVANCVVEQDAAGNIKPSKAKSTERIDGVPMLIMAIARDMAPRDDQPVVKPQFFVFGGDDVEEE